MSCAGNAEWARVSSAGVVGGTMAATRGEAGGRRDGRSRGGGGGGGRASALPPPVVGLECLAPARLRSQAEASGIRSLC